MAGLQGVLGAQAGIILTKILVRGRHFARYAGQWRSCENFWLFFGKALLIVLMSASHVAEFVIDDQKGSRVGEMPRNEDQSVPSVIVTDKQTGMPLLSKQHG